MSERELAEYYDREGSERANRDLAPGRHDARHRFLATYASPGMRSLEIGCGPGRDLASFVEAGLDACGVDLSSVFAQLAASTGAHVANATARLLPFRECSVDVVWSMSVLMHLPDDDITDALDEIRRVLVPDGVACIGVWGQDDAPCVLEGKFGPRYFANRSRLAWQPLLERVGTILEYEVWDAEGDGFTYHWAVLRRTI